MDNGVTLKEVLDLARQLSLLDKVRLIEQITLQIERAVETSHPIPRKSLRGLWKGLDITEEDIAGARHDMWGNFPRQDI